MAAKRLPVLVLLALFTSVAQGRRNVTSGIAYLRVVSKGGQFENYCAYMDTRVALGLGATFAKSLLRPLLDLYPDTGCNSTNAAGQVAIVARGGCTFEQKVQVAKASGAAGLLVVSDTRYHPAIVADSNYSVALVSVVAYRSLVDLQPDASAALYRPVGDSGRRFLFLALYAMAVLTLLLGCMSAAHSLRLRLPRASGASELKLSKATWLQLAAFILIMLAVPVCVLLLLNFAYDYVVWVLLVLYGYYAASSLVFCADRLYVLVARQWRQQEPTTWPARTHTWNLGKCCGAVTFSNLELAAYPLALAAAVVWFVFRNAHWAFLLTNIFNVFLVIRVIEALAQVLRIRIVTILLLAFLVYDVFFVFITPLLSGQSAQQPAPTTPAPTVSRVKRDTVMDFYVERDGSFMERVALGTAGLSGEIIPIVFKVMPYPPEESVSTCLLPYSILGLGDVILPSTLLSLNLFFDLVWQHRCWPYFLSSLVGYLLGLGACAAVLLATGSGQPALLYIVPCILATSYLCALLRRELKMYFRNQLPEPYASANEQPLQNEEAENSSLPCANSERAA